MLLSSMEALMHSMHFLPVHTNFSGHIDCTAEVPWPAICGSIAEPFSGLMERDFFVLKAALSDIKI
jgi:hypothetical protein